MIGTESAADMMVTDELRECAHIVEKHMGLMKIKVFDTVQGTLVSVDGRAAYVSRNSGGTEGDNIKSLCDKLGIEVEIEVKERMEKKDA